MPHLGLNSRHGLSVGLCSGKVAKQRRVLRDHQES